MDVFKISGVRAEDTIGRIILVFIQKSFRNYVCLQKTLFLSYSNMESLHPSLWKHAVGVMHLDERHASDSSHLVAR